MSVDFMFKCQECGWWSEIGKPCGKCAYDSKKEAYKKKYKKEVSNLIRSTT